MPKHNRAGFRRCFTCRVEFPLTPEHFHREKSRPAGLAYRCKPCQAVVAARKPKRPQRWAAMTPDQKSRRRVSQKKYWNSVAISKKRVLSYQAFDKKKGLEFDIDLEWYEQHIHSQPCHYCGVTDEDIGCDRIDNSKGHTKNNVIPACALCNVTRMDNFSYDEMIVLGETIRKLRLARQAVHLSVDNRVATMAQCPVSTHRC